MIIPPGSALWQYLSPWQRNLIDDGEFLLQDSEVHQDEEPTDYSYIVFPFAKMYEGFLKQLFADLNIISERDYYSSHFRIGKVLSPNLASRLGRRSAYKQIEIRFGRKLADNLWKVWKEARNLVFHYFPHNFRSLSRQDAKNLVIFIITTIDEAVKLTRVKPKRRNEDFCYVGEGRHDYKPLAVDKRRAVS